MYGLAKHTDLSFLKGRELIQVQIGWGEAQLIFEEPTRISIQSQIQLVYPNEYWEAHSHFPFAANALSKLLGQKVGTVEIESEGLLKLTFSNGTILEISEDKVPYESYQIHHGDKIIVV